jgi:thiol-activated cytolysin
VGLKHSGAYVAKFHVTWVEDGKQKQWASGNKTAGYTHKLLFGRGARAIHINAQAATGLIWDPWGTILNERFASPPNAVLNVKGTTLHRKWDKQRRF